MNSSINYIKQYSRLLDERPEYLRWIIVIIILGLLLTFWLFALLLPISSKISSLFAKISIVSKNIDTINNDYKNYQLLDQEFPHLSLTNKIKALENELSQLQKHPLLSKDIADSPQKMQNLIQAFANTGPNISLDSIENIAEKPTAPQPKTGSAPYKKITIKFHGGFFATLQYLNYLDNLPWYFNFESLDYQVEQYPNARVQVVLGIINKL